MTYILKYLVTFLVWAHQLIDYFKGINIYSSLSLLVLSLMMFWQRKDPITSIGKIIIVMSSSKGLAKASSVIIKCAETRIWKV